VQAGLKTSKLPADVRDRVLTRYRLRLKTKATIGAGNYKPGIRVLMIGEQTSHPEKFALHIPFCSVKACSGWLNTHLQAAEIPEEEMFWLNALDNDGSYVDLGQHYNFLQPTHVVALGTIAHKRLMFYGIEHEWFTHPQHHRRFKHSEPYPAITFLKKIFYD
jgi:hypothetical protein